MNQTVCEGDTFDYLTEEVKYTYCFSNQNSGPR